MSYFDDWHGKIQARCNINWALILVPRTRFGWFLKKKKHLRLYCILYSLLPEIYNKAYTFYRTTEFYTVFKLNLISVIVVHKSNRPMVANSSWCCYTIKRVLLLIFIRLFSFIDPYTFLTFQGTILKYYAYKFNFIKFYSTD